MVELVKLARIELEVSSPEMCPHGKVTRDYTTHDISYIECIYPYVRTCIPKGTNLGKELDCKWFKGNESKCPLDDAP